MISRTFGMERSSSYSSYIDLVIEDSHKILQKVLKRNILSRYFQGFSKIFGDLCKIFEQNLWRPLKQGPRSKFSSWGAKEECVKEIFGGGGRGGGHACGFLFNLSEVTVNAIITIKLLIFFHIFSDVAMGPQNSPSLNWNIIDCYVILLMSTFNYYK